MINLWLILALGCMAADWAALWKAHSSINYLTKPLALLLLMVWFWSTAGSGWVAFCFLLGFFFSLIGDAFLLLPHRYFKYGLGAFLCTHISYMAGFMIGVENLPLWFWVLAGLTGGWAAIVIIRLVGGARQNPHHRRMALPIILYAGAISLMLLFAAWTMFRQDWSKDAAILSVCGALLFYFSDLYLAFDRFVQPLQHARLMVRISYHLGQLALAAGVVLYSRSG